MKAGNRLQFAALVVLFLVLGVPTSGAQDPPAQGRTAPNVGAASDRIPVNLQDPRYRLAVEVELVNVTATVLDQNGAYLEGLTADDFQIFEDGQEQAISFFSFDQRVPLSIGVLIDVSGSMRHKLQQALETVGEIIQALSPEDEVFLVSFDSDVDVIHSFTSNGRDVQSALREMRASGETAVYDAVRIGLNEMQRARHNKKILLLVSDGFDTRSDINMLEVEELLKRSQTLVYAIGIDDDDNDPLVARRTRYHIYHYMLGRLTGISGGRAFRLFTGRRYALQSLAQVLLEELHQQYTLSYYPAPGRAETEWRELEVRVQKSGSQIRHRTGYYVNTVTP